MCYIHLMFMSIVALKITFVIAFVIAEMALIHGDVSRALIFDVPSEGLSVHVSAFAYGAHIVHLVVFVLYYKHCRFHPRH